MPVPGISAERLCVQGPVSPGNLAMFVDGRTITDAGVASSNQQLAISLLLTPTQVNNMDNTAANAVDIVPAVAGQVFIPDFAVWNLQFASTPYATGLNSMVLQWKTSGGSLVVPTFSALGTTSDIKASASVLNTAWQTIGQDITSLAALLGSSLALCLTGSTKYTAGDSPILVVVFGRRYTVL